MSIEVVSTISGSYNTSLGLSWVIMLRRSQDNYSPYSPRRAVVSNLNQGGSSSIGSCLGPLSRVMYISHWAYKRAPGCRFGSSSLWSTLLRTSSGRHDKYIF